MLPECMVLQLCTVYLINQFRVQVASPCLESLQREQQWLPYFDPGSSLHNPCTLKRTQICLLDLIKISLSRFHSAKKGQFSLFDCIAMHMLAWCPVSPH